MTPLTWIIGLCVPLRELHCLLVDRTYKKLVYTFGAGLCIFSSACFDSEWEIEVDKTNVCRGVTSRCFTVQVDLDDGHEEESSREYTRTTWSDFAAAFHESVTSKHFLWLVWQQRSITGRWLSCRRTVSVWCRLSFICYLVAKLLSRLPAYTSFECVMRFTLARPLVEISRN